MCHLEGEAGVKLLERIGWGLGDAERREREAMEAAISEASVAEAAVAQAAHNQRRSRRIRGVTAYTEISG